MKTHIVVKPFPDESLEVWLCPFRDCKHNAIREVGFSEREHWVSAIHHHLSGHVSIEQMEALALGDSLAYEQTTIITDTSGKAIGLTKP